MRVLAAILCLLAAPAWAEAVVAARTLPANSVLSFSDLALSAKPIAGAVTDPRDAVGLETRITIYAGRPVRAGDLRPPALVERNQIVSIVFTRGNLTIAADGRALGRGGAGDRLRVMNLSSRSTLFGIVAADGSIHVTQ